MCAHAGEEKNGRGREKPSDTNNPVMQICAADFEVETQTGILQSFAAAKKKKYDKIEKKKKGGGLQSRKKQTEKEETVT